MKIVFALVKSRSPPLGYGKIWAEPYWNMGKVWMLLLTQIMAKCRTYRFTQNLEDWQNLVAQ